MYVLYGILKIAETLAVTIFNGFFTAFYFDNLLIYGNDDPLSGCQLLSGYSINFADIPDDAANVSIGRSVFCSDIPKRIAVLNLNLVILIQG